MSPTPIPAQASAPKAPTFRFDLVAGLTAAAVVLPKAMAYASVAGLPVAVGLYTAFIPMAIYALLGTSRVLSVSSTTTIAILAGTQLGLAVPDGDPARLVTATATLTLLVGAALVAGVAIETRLRRQLHIDAGADRIQGRHRVGDRARPGAQAAGHPHHQARLLLRCRQRRQPPPRNLDDHADGRPRDLRGADRDGTAVAALAGPAGRGGGRHRRGVVPRAGEDGRLDRRADPAGLPVADTARSCAGRTAAAGCTRNRLDELHRVDRGRARLRARRRSCRSTRTGNCSPPARRTLAARCSAPCRPAEERRRRRSCAPPAGSRSWPRW